MVLFTEGIILKFYEIPKIEFWELFAGDVIATSEEIPPEEETEEETDDKYIVDGGEL